MTTDRIIDEALQVVKTKIFGESEIGMVDSALITYKDKIFKGVCIYTMDGLKA